MVVAGEGEGEDCGPKLSPGKVVWRRSVRVGYQAAAVKVDVL